MIAAPTNQDALPTPAEPSPTPHSNAVVRTLRADQRTTWHDHDVALHDDRPGNDGDGEFCLSRTDWIPVPGTGGLGGQLEVFAAIDQAAAALARSEARRRFDAAPSSFGLAVTGYCARLAAEKRAAEHGSFDCHRRSHAWPAAGHGDQRTEQCRPVTLNVDLRCQHENDSCCYVGDLRHRRACLHCPWAGPVRDSHHSAAQDAHHHSGAGWRDLPSAARRPESGTSSRHQTSADRWARQVNAVYPTGWLEAGDPIRTVRRPMGRRHVPGHTGFGGYEESASLDEAALDAGPDPNAPEQP